jgi:tripartite-type tricarboxylate transporter receptor subunit TctC
VGGAFLAGFAACRDVARDYTTSPERISSTGPPSGAIDTPITPGYECFGKNFPPISKARGQGMIAMAKLLALAARAIGLLLAVMAFAGPAVAQDYPTRSIRLIIPFPPGGSNDVVGRIIANQLGEKLGKQVFVDNRSGAGGVVGTDLAAKAAADGYTLLVISIAHAVDPWLYKEPFDPAKDFVPVSIIATGTNVLTVNPTVPVHSVKELLDLAKAKPGVLNYASAGIGSFQHLSGELFKLLAGVNIVHVPYKGGGPAMLAVIAGEDQVMFSSIVQTVPNIQSGQLRALATGGERRSPILPDLPTIAEAGVPGYVATNWWGIVAPAGTPQPIVDKLHDTIAGLLDSPQTKKFLDNEGAAPVHMSSAEFGKFVAAEIAKWGPVAQKAGMKAE